MGVWIVTLHLSKLTKCKNWKNIYVESNTWGSSYSRAPRVLPWSHVTPMQFFKIIWNRRTGNWSIVKRPSSKMMKCTNRKNEVSEVAHKSEVTQVDCIVVNKDTMSTGRKWTIWSWHYTPFGFKMVENKISLWNIFYQFLQDSWSTQFRFFFTDVTASYSQKFQIAKSPHLTILITLCYLFVS